jgi:aspartyl-tRNA(Asn)/glutamyl-tRNA(Gln) amidotransferase subunit C
MTELTRDDVLKLARLARLELTEDEIEAYRTQLSAVLDYVAQLQQVDIEGLEPTTQVTGLTNVMRDDELLDYGIDPKELLQLAPQNEDGHIKVKRMIA